MFAISYIRTHIAVLTILFSAACKDKEERPDAGSNPSDAGIRVDSGGADAGETEDAGGADTGGADAGGADAGGADAGEADAGDVEDLPSGGSIDLRVLTAFGDSITTARASFWSAVTLPPGARDPHEYFSFYFMPLDAGLESCVFTPLDGIPGADTATVAELTDVDVGATVEIATGTTTRIILDRMVNSATITYQPATFPLPFGVPAGAEYSVELAGTATIPAESWSDVIRLPDHFTASATIAANGDVIGQWTGTGEGNEVHFRIVSLATRDAWDCLVADDGEFTLPAAQADDLPGPLFLIVDRVNRAFVPWNGRKVRIEAGVVELGGPLFP